MPAELSATGHRDRRQMLPAGVIGRQCGVFELRVSRRTDADCAQQLLLRQRTRLRRIERRSRLLRGSGRQRPMRAAAAVRALGQQSELPIGLRPVTPRSAALAAWRASHVDRRLLPGGTGAERSQQERVRAARAYSDRPLCCAYFQGPKTTSW